MSPWVSLELRPTAVARPTTPATVMSERHPWRAQSSELDALHSRGLAEPNGGSVRGRARGCVRDGGHAALPGRQSEECILEGSRAGRKVGDCRVGEQAAASDDDQMVGHQRDLADQVAGHQHGSALRARPRSRVRIQRTPWGSRPFTGSSRISTPGSPSSAEAMPSRWDMPSENLPARRRAASDRPDHAEDLVHPGVRDIPRCGEHPKVRTRRSGRMKRPGLELRAHLPQRPGEIVVGPPADRGPAGIRPVQAQDHPHRRGLARAVRTEEPGHRARLHGKAKVVDGPHWAVPLAEAADLDHEASLAGHAGRVPVSPTLESPSAKEHVAGWRPGPPDGPRSVRGITPASAQASDPCSRPICPAQQRRAAVSGR